MDSQPISWIAFEDEVFKQVKRWVQGGSSFVCPKRAQFYRKKSYYSEPRKAFVDFEVAIEAFDEEATEPSLVWVFECKDTARTSDW